MAFVLLKKQVICTFHFYQRDIILKHSMRRNMLFAKIYPETFYNKCFLRIMTNRQSIPDLLIIIQIFMIDCLNQSIS